MPPRGSSRQPARRAPPAPTTTTWTEQDVLDICLQRVHGTLEPPKLLVAGGSKNVRQLREAIAAAAGEAESCSFMHDPAVCGHTKRELVDAMSTLLEDYLVDENDAQPEKVKLVAKQGSNTIHLGLAWRGARRRRRG